MARYPKTIDDWKVEFQRLDAISKRQELSEYQSLRLAAAIRMIDNEGKPPRPDNEWPEEDVAKLCDVIADGGSFADAAKVLGRGRVSCIARFRRLANRLGWQAA